MRHIWLSFHHPEVFFYYICDCFWSDTLPFHNFNGPFSTEHSKLSPSTYHFILTLPEIFLLDCVQAKLDQNYLSAPGTYHVCVCVCVRERETGSHHSWVYSLSEIVLFTACLQTHSSFIMSVTLLCSPLRHELMVKLRTLLTVFTLILRAEAHHAACGVRPITMSWVSWPIRADCAL